MCQVLCLVWGCGRAQVDKDPFSRRFQLESVSSSIRCRIISLRLQELE